MNTALRASVLVEQAVQLVMITRRLMIQQRVSAFATPVFMICHNSVPLVLLPAKPVQALLLPPR